MKELVKIIACALVDHPEKIVVDETVETEGDRETIVVHLTVPEDEMGKVIGKQGRIAKALRTVVKAAASREDKRVVVEIQQ
jgi:predicted RNA-binding protein YlqC (UPF0109 family)